MRDGASTRAGRPGGGRPRRRRMAFASARGGCAGTPRGGSRARPVPRANDPPGAPAPRGSRSFGPSAPAPRSLGAATGGAPRTTCGRAGRPRQGAGDAHARRSPRRRALCPRPGDRARRPWLRRRGDRLRPRASGGGGRARHGGFEELEPERDRAVRVAAAAGGAARAARVLARRGFGEDAIEAAVGHVA